MPSATCTTFTTSSQMGGSGQMPRRITATSLNTSDTVVLVPVWAHRVGHLEEINNFTDQR